jgi:hypothetical protein
MPFLFISRSRHDAEYQLWSRLLESKELRIRELEAERRLLWDKICLLGIGAPLFTPVPGIEPESSEEKQATPAAPMRPSAIMRRQDRLAEDRWLRRMRPGKAAEPERQRVMAQFDRAHEQGVESASEVHKPLSDE